MSKGKDDLGDRMKAYERAEAGRRFMPLLPVLVRLDGKNFSSWTRGLQRPYHQGLTDLMVAVTRYLVEESNATIGYTQSDEISLVLYSDNYKSQIFFDGRIQKLTSVLASMATWAFNAWGPMHIPEKRRVAFQPAFQPAFFDCRCWQVPTLLEAVNMLYWREVDATKNSVSMAAREYYSHLELHEKGRANQMDMLMAKGVNWDKYPSYFKRGTYVQRKKIVRAFTAEEIDKLPAQHEARVNPALMVERSEIQVLEMPPFSKVLNKEGVIFRGEKPIREPNGPGGV
jgi:tRNA(His) guanylyltransferase